MQGKAKQALRDIYLAESRQTAEAALDRFKNLYEKKFPKAVECLEKDRQVLLAFYDFPAEHWGHLEPSGVRRVLETEPPVVQVMTEFMAQGA